MFGWIHQLNGREFDQAPEVSNGQGSLACCSPWYFYGMTYNVNSLISDFTWAFAPFILVSLAKGVSILFIFSKNQHLASLSFPLVFCSPFHLFLLWSLLFLSFWQIRLNLLLFFFWFLEIWNYIAYFRFFSYCRHL